MKIVVLDGYTLNPGDLSWGGFEKLGELTVHDRISYNPADTEKIVDQAKDAEAILTNKTPITKEMLNLLPNLKYIGVLATGYNVIDIEAAKDRGIVVSNIPGYGTDAVAQMVFALLLEVCNHVGAHGEAVRNGEWTNHKDWCFWHHPLIELANKTLGLIGYGSIGQATAKIAQAFGMNVVVHTRTPKPELENERLKFVGLDELFAQSDVISLHCPLTENNKGMINKSSIAKMKDGVIIINTARGPLINEANLAEALNSGKVLGAAVDVVSVEPMQADNPLLTAKNSIITPHIAWAPKEARERLMNMAVDNLHAFISGKPVNIVNP
ncbi:D-2-hydroxyacid dehydrogenase [Desulfuribacillus alkaliarsenatis]|uniref:Glycerate dehydrogenase n=1 Tax=Desulfuribacillus alkaliarsenatis TaxID=766136 RepID=A0A1E5G253_9FIRM|nr:D-2-hydroxyacid dehydrogenase [Desulfuribacillus alkaliarsenatis]OEF96609.1 glycerate dehydrogenase [Desulfuribacillus alkaliarsenatis]